jgi:hypothetical protein
VGISDRRELRALDRRLPGNRRYQGEYVSGILFAGADDFDDILPYARQEDLIVVTNNVLDFKPLAGDEHEGIVVVYNQRLSA